MDLLAVGSKVKIGEHNSIVATVSAITIRGVGVMYEVYYWQGETRHELWVFDEELSYDRSADTFNVSLNMS